MKIQGSGQDGLDTNALRIIVCLTLPWASGRYFTYTWVQVGAVDRELSFKVQGSRV